MSVSVRKQTFREYPEWVAKQTFVGISEWVENEYFEASTRGFHVGGYERRDRDYSGASSRLPQRDLIPDILRQPLEGRRADALLQSARRYCLKSIAWNWDLHVGR